MQRSSFLTAVVLHRGGAQRHNAEKAEEAQPLPRKNDTEDEGQAGGNMNCFNAVTNLHFAILSRISDSPVYPNSKNNRVIYRQLRRKSVGSAIIYPGV